MAVDVRAGHTIRHLQNVARPAATARAFQIFNLSRVHTERLPFLLVGCRDHP